MTIRCVLMDIEGTITSVAFVREVLFPYAKRRLASFLQEQRENPTVHQWATFCQNTIAQEGGVRPAYEDLSDILTCWIEEDRKHPGLKALQGMIWEEGYRTGAFAPALYEDVVPVLLQWRGNGVQRALYSSGSEQAQRLLLAHTTKGNLTYLFSQFFDTRIGAKTEAASYRLIAERLALPAEDILFLSDAEAELEAAAAAGCKTTQIVRPGTRASTRHPVSSDFRTLNDLGLTQPCPALPSRQSERLR